MIKLNPFCMYGVPGQQPGIYNNRVGETPVAANSEPNESTSIEAAFKKPNDLLLSAAMHPTQLPEYFFDPTVGVANDVKSAISQGGFMGIHLQPMLESKQGGIAVRPASDILQKMVELGYTGASGRLDIVNQQEFRDGVFYIGSEAVKLDRLLLGLAMGQKFISGASDDLYWIPLLNGSESHFDKEGAINLLMSSTQIKAIVGQLVEHVEQMKALNQKSLLEIIVNELRQRYTDYVPPVLEDGTSAGSGRSTDVEASIATIKSDETPIVTFPTDELVYDSLISTGYQPHTAIYLSHMLTRNGVVVPIDNVALRFSGLDQVANRFETRDITYSAENRFISKVSDDYNTLSLFIDNHPFIKELKFGEILLGLALSEIDDKSDGKLKVPILDHSVNGEEREIHSDGGINILLTPDEAKTLLKEINESCWRRATENNYAILALLETLGLRIDSIKGMHASTSETQ